MYEWLFEVILHNGDHEYVTVCTETRSYYEAEEKALALPSVKCIGHYVEDPDENLILWE